MTSQQQDNYMTSQHCAYGTLVHHSFPLCAPNMDFALFGMERKYKNVVINRYKVYTLCDATVKPKHINFNISITQSVHGEKNEKEKI